MSNEEEQPRGTAGTEKKTCFKRRFLKEVRGSRVERRRHQPVKPPKTVPVWLDAAAKGAQIIATFVNVVVLFMVISQLRLNERSLQLSRKASAFNERTIKNQERTIKMQEDAYRVNQEAADRVWTSQLIATIFEVADCPKRNKKNCPPKSSFRSREEAVLAYIKLQNVREKPINLADAELSGMTLPKIAIPRADLSRATLSGTTLIEAVLRHVRFTRADLSDATLTNANLSGAFFDYASLAGANLEGAKLEGVRFDYAQLVSEVCEWDEATGEYPGSARLKGAYLKDASFKGAAVCGVDVSDTDLSYAKDLTQMQLDVMKGDKLTKPPLEPSNLHRPKAWGNGHP